MIEKTSSGRIYRYSDQGKMLLQNETGNLYPNALNRLDAPYTYTETDMDIPAEDEEAETYLKS